MRGLVSHWPLVQAAQQSDRAYCDYLRGFGSETRLGLWRAPEANGRFFYNGDFSGFNFSAKSAPLAPCWMNCWPTRTTLRRPASTWALPGSDRSFPACVPRTTCGLQPHDPLVSLWLGNRARVATHYDLPDNVACVVSGASPLHFSRPIRSGTSTSARSTTPPPASRHQPRRCRRAGL